MNASRLFAATVAVSAIAFSVQAQTMSPSETLSAPGLVPVALVYETAQPSTNIPTREQVKAELVAARANGELRPDADNHGSTRDEPVGSTLSRDEVKQGIALARVDGELNTAADNQPVERVFFVSDKTRAETKAETRSEIAASGKGLSQGDKSHYTTPY